MELEHNIKLKFFEKRYTQLQNVVLQLEVDIKTAEAQVVTLKGLKERAETECGQLKTDIMRLKAAEEEAKVK